MIDAMKYLRRKGIGKSDAEDIIQDTYERILKYKPSFIKNEKYFTTVLSNVLNDFYNSKKRDDKVEFSENSPKVASESPEDFLIRKQDIELLIPHEQRDVISLYLKGFTVQEICTELDATPGSVKKILHRFRQRRRELME